MGERRQPWVLTGDSECPLCRGPFQLRGVGGGALRTVPMRLHCPAPPPAPGERNHPDGDRGVKPHEHTSRAGPVSPPAGCGRLSRHVWCSRSQVGGGWGVGRPWAGRWGQFLIGASPQRSEAVHSAARTPPPSLPSPRLSPSYRTSSASASLSIKHEKAIIPLPHDQ